MKPLYNLLSVFILLLLGACHKPEDNLPPKPTAAFTISAPFGARDTTRFVNSSSNADSYYWDFGDGATSTEKSPGHAFQQAGHYTVKLEAAGAGGMATHTADVDILAKPIVAFRVLGPYSLGDSMQFVNSTTGASQYLWDFGDGSTATRTSPKHQYRQTGQYTVKLRATGSGGTAELSQVVHVYNPPAGYVCNCRVARQYVPGAYTILPNEVITIGNYGNNGGIEFKGVTYDLIPGGATDHLYFRSTLYAASVYGSVLFYPATDSIHVSYRSGGLGGGMTMYYHCKKQ